MARVELSNHVVKRLLDSVSGEIIPWGVERVGARETWSLGKGAGQVVAILDTGCDPDHPDLAGRVAGGRNFTTDYGGDPENFRDNHYHGTHVAGTAAAVLNGAGLVGVAPECRLLIGKVLNGEGSGETGWVTEGIRWATAWRGPNGERARVISMSLGGPEDDPDMHRAIQEAVAAGVLVVCAAGNDGPGQAEYPGSYPEVVEVGATDRNNNVANFSNTNPELDLVAPGVDIPSTYPGGRYAILSGTSMATPHVSAAAALITQQEETAYQRTLTEPEMFALLLRRVKDLGLPKTVQGAGLLSLGTVPPPAHSYRVQVVRQRLLPAGYTVHLGTYKQKSAAMEMVRMLKSDLEKAGARVEVRE